jgi:hypothetical protein
MVTSPLACALSLGGIVTRAPQVSGNALVDPIFNNG